MPDRVDTGLKAELNGALQSPAPYYAEVLEKKPTKPGCWEHLRVGVFDRTGAQMGEYQRNYPSLYSTFHPFELRGKWYALYSKNYTSTRLMSLPDCQDIGGEEDESSGFCPTDYWVPPLHWLEISHYPNYPRGKGENTACTCDPSNRSLDTWRFPERIHGFIAGCFWGDDCSWKIQYLDLSRADEGILKRDERFGYLELPENLTLDKAVHLDVSGSGMNWTLRIASESYYDINSGKSVYE